MELLDGRPLSELRNGLSISEAVAIADQILRGLAHAHRMGVIHRDLKPDNIMVIDRGGERRIKILDFGLAKIGEAEGVALTQAGSVFGTPRYMAPEQASGEEIDPRADQYAVGVILYELLTGRAPFEGENVRQVLAGHLLDPPPPLRLPAIPGVNVAAIEAVILRALAKSPAERFESADAMRLALAERFRSRRVVSPCPRPGPSLPPQSS